MTVSGSTLTPTAMTYDELLEILTAIRATLVLGQVALEYTMRQADSFVGAIRGKVFGIARGASTPPTYGLHLDMLADLVENTNTRKVLTMNFNLLMKQDLIRTGYEHIAHFCEEHGLFGEMKAQPWWMFARIVRNMISHKTGARLHRWPSDAPDTVTWRGITIAKADMGKDVVFLPDDAFHLFDEMVGFARTLWPVAPAAGSP